MDRINHFKIVTPDPAAVDRFLREVVGTSPGLARWGSRGSAGAA